MPLFNSEAIVLRSINLSEADKLVTFMTNRYGNVKCIAKAARKIKNRFGATIEPLSHIRLIYFEILDSFFLRKMAFYFKRVYK